MSREYNNSIVSYQAAFISVARLLDIVDTKGKNKKLIKDMKDAVLMCPEVTVAIGAPTVYTRTQMKAAIDRFQFVVLNGIPDPKFKSKYQGAVESIISCLKSGADISPVTLGAKLDSLVDSINTHNEAGRSKKARATDAADDAKKHLDVFLAQFNRPSASSSRVPNIFNGAVHAGAGDSSSSDEDDKRPEFKR